MVAPIGSTPRGSTPFTICSTSVLLKRSYSKVLNREGGFSFSTRSSHSPPAALDGPHKDWTDGFPVATQTPLPLAALSPRAPACHSPASLPPAAATAPTAERSVAAPRHNGGSMLPPRHGCMAVLRCSQRNCADARCLGCALFFFFFVTAGHSSLLYSATAGACCLA